LWLLLLLLLPLLLLLLLLSVFWAQGGSSRRDADPVRTIRRISRNVVRKPRR